MVRRSFLLLRSSKLRSYTCLLIARNKARVQPNTISILMLTVRSSPLTVTMGKLSRTNGGQSAVFAGVRCLRRRLAAECTTDFSTTQQRSDCVSPGFAVCHLNFDGSGAVPAVVRPSLQRYFISGQAPLSLLRCCSRYSKGSCFLMQTVYGGIPVTRILFIPRTGYLVDLPSSTRGFVQCRARRCLEAFCDAIQGVYSADLKKSHRFLLLFGLVRVSANPTLDISLMCVIVQAVTGGDVTLPRVLFVFLIVLLFALPILLASVLNEVHSGIC